MLQIESVVEGSNTKIQEKHLREIMHIESRPRPRRRELSRKNYDVVNYDIYTNEDEDPIVIEYILANGEVKHVLIDCGSLDDLFYEAYKGLQLFDRYLLPYKPITQKKRQMSVEKQEIIKQPTQELVKAGIIWEIKYTT